MKTLMDGEARVLPVPYYTGKAPDEVQKVNAPRGIQFTAKQKIKKGFDHVFSLLEFDMKPDMMLNTIQFYHRSFFGLRRKLLFEIDCEELKNIEGLADAEKYISPIIYCEAGAEGLDNFELLDDARPMEDVILDHHNNINQTITT